MENKKLNNKMFSVLDRKEASLILGGEECGEEKIVTKTKYISKTTGWTIYDETYKTYNCTYDKDGNVTGGAWSGLQERTIDMHP